MKLIWGLQSWTLPLQSVMETRHIQTLEAWRVPEWARAPRVPLFLCVVWSWWMVMGDAAWKVLKTSGDIRISRVPLHHHPPGSFQLRCFPAFLGQPEWVPPAPPPCLPCAYKSTFWSIPSLGPSLFCPIADKVPGPTTKLTPPPLRNISTIARREGERERGDYCIWT